MALRSSSVILRNLAPGAPRIIHPIQVAEAQRLEQVRPRHNLIDNPRLHVTSPHDLDKGRFVIIGNAGGVRRNVGAGHSSPRPLEDLTAAVLETRQWSPLFHRRMAIAAGRDGRQIASALYRTREIWCGDGFCDRLWYNPNQVVDGKLDLRWRQRIPHGGKERRNTTMDATSSSESWLSCR